MTEHAFQIELEDLIKLLAQNLYSDADVFLREMIQNAHDSILRRKHRAHGPDASALEGRITIRTCGQETLCIEDNGAGMSETELHGHLSTIGRGGTGELIKEIVKQDRNATIDLIGQFGIGLLSAFVVAEQVDVITRANGSPALRWSSTGGGRYSVNAAERSEIGASVYLRLKTRHRGYLSTERLRSIIKTYADFIGIPIYLEREQAPANAMHALWHRAEIQDAKEREAAYLRYWQDRFPNETCLAVLPIDVEFEYIEAGASAPARKAQARGVLGVSGREQFGVGARGTVDVYVKRMFVSRGNRDLLPGWAKFMRGVIESPVLTPNAARDNIMHDSALAGLRERLHEVIATWLTTMSSRDPVRFNEIMRMHRYGILSMCSLDEHDDFFKAVADLIPLETAGGSITIPAYLESAPRLENTTAREVYYFNDEGAASQHYLLCEARNLRVFNASEPFAESFLRRYAQWRPERIVLRDAAKLEGMFQALGEAEAEDFLALQSACQSLLIAERCNVQLSHFAPKEVPAVLTRPPGDTQYAIEEVTNDPATPDWLVKMMQAHLDEVGQPWTLYLNANNHIIQQLARYSALHDAHVKTALHALRFNAMLLTRSVPPSVLSRASEHYNALLEVMLSTREQLRELSTKHEELLARQRDLEAMRSVDPNECITCFVAMPFTDRLSPVYGAIEAVLEDIPFLWRVVRADEEKRGSVLWENVKRQMLSAHCFIAEVSDHNPNVMIEIGRMEAIGRPFLLLKQKDSPPLPADLHGQLYAEYDERSPDLVSRLSAEFARHTEFCAQRGEPHLSPALLRRTSIKPELHRPLSEAFPRVKDFLVQASDSIGRRWGVNSRIIDGVKDEIKELISPLSQVADS